MLVSALAMTDASEAQIFSASSFREVVYGDGMVASRSQTPMKVCRTPATATALVLCSYQRIPPGPGPWSAR